MQTTMKALKAPNKNFTDFWMIDTMADESFYLEINSWN